MSAMRGSRRYVAQQVIQRAYAEAQRRGLEGKELVALIDAHYPFGERAHYPYQMWLVERNRLLVELGLAKPTKALRRLQRWERGETGRRISPAELMERGQLLLIGGDE